MRFLTRFIALVLFAISGFWCWENLPEVRSLVHDLLSLGKFQTLEVRHSAEMIMHKHQKSLLTDDNHTFLEPTLKFYPYLLMEVKYTKPTGRTGEGILLWSLVDGEMVINTRSWEKTHGFLDCIDSGADLNDFKIINALSQKGGILDREGLSQLLGENNEKLDLWLESCRKKSLIVQTGNFFRLHLQNPKLQAIPETKLDHWLVTKSAKSAIRVPKKYRASQIETIAKAAFGKDFAIRKKIEVFLPVYSIIVQNPDGSQMTTYWNALNGQKVEKPYHLE